MVSDVRADFVGRPDTALRHATTRIPTAAANDLVSSTLDGLRGGRFDSAAAVAVLEEDRLVGVATIERLFAAADGATLGDLIDATPPVVAPEADQEHAAWQAVQRDEPGLAVVAVALPNVRQGPRVRFGTAGDRGAGSAVDSDLSRRGSSRANRSGSLTYR